MNYNIGLIIPVIMGLSELLKKIGIDAKYIPVVDLIFGVLAGVFYVYPTDIKAGVFFGIIIGLSACGMYSGAKNLIKG